MMPVRFKARIGDDGEIVLDIHAFRITQKSWFVRKHWREDAGEVPEFALVGTAADGLSFESDSLTFSSLGERWSGIHNHHYSKPRGECGKAVFRRALETPSGKTVLKLHLKGFECFPPLRGHCALGEVHVAGATSLDVYDQLAGYIYIRAEVAPIDDTEWRAEAEQLAEHIRRILSFAASALLRAPVLEFVHGTVHEVEVLSQTRQHAPTMRVFHKLDQQRLLDTALAAWSNPPVKATNLFFAIEWFAMTTTYDEVRLVNAMTALENLIDSNLTDDEKLIEPTNVFEKTRRALRAVIGRCLEHWSPERADAARKQLGEKLLDLNRRTLRCKLRLLADRWQVPFEGISDAQIGNAIRARNAIVHSGHRGSAALGDDLWDHVTIVRELVVRFMLTAIGYRGQYLSHVGGYHFAEFPPPALGKAQPEVPAS